MSTDKGLMLEIGCTHADTKFFRLIGTGDYAAIIVGKYHHRSVSQVRAEKSFAGDIKVIAVYESKHFFAVELLHCFIQVILTGKHSYYNRKYRVSSNNCSLPKYMLVPLHDVQNRGRHAGNI